MGTAQFDDYTHILPPVVLTPVLGGAAGAFTLTGIATTDKIISVYRVGFNVNAVPTTVSDLTSEFSITGSNTIDNTGGTASTSDLLLVLWADYDK